MQAYVLQMYDNCKTSPCTDFVHTVAAKDNTEQTIYTHITPLTQIAEHPQLRYNTLLALPLGVGHRGTCEKFRKTPFRNTNPGIVTNK